MLTSAHSSTSALKPTCSVPNRWNASKGEKNSQHVLNHHYLRNLSIEVALANAGFKATAWNDYCLPRSRGSSIHDDYIQRLIEFFFPNLYELCARTFAAFEGNPTFDSDVISETNYRFTHTLRDLMLFWLQDAVVILEELPALADYPPWSSLYKNDDVKRDFTRLGSVVSDAISIDSQQTHERLLNQRDLLQTLRTGCDRTAHHLTHRLAALPKDVSHLVRQAFVQNYEAQCADLKDVVQEALRSSFQTMFAAAGGMPHSSSSRTTSASSAHKCVSPNGSECGSEEHVPDDDASASASASPPASAGEGSPSNHPEGPPAPARRAWQMPAPSGGSPFEAPPKRRKPLPAADSLSTELGLAAGLSLLTLP